eukprot:Blabericola_migrator_1__3152@NODE_1920_length_3560_cov_242_651303_g1227_i0_p3_GENE_NODE_1920_length_3560_cov_242_651303_g1227_i0NODE_1920_length_3560_cov_242_651303_g1227_i0_p3_ORF_typecomplete_len223_score59_34PheRS_DBD1/PF18552_1/1_5e10PheRS_DBD1/PF18552_1/2_3e03DUF480/PF04337_12/0_0019MarR/PF01047_22/0_021MarR/PF01047_22/6_8e02MarR/PF01047_22/7e03HTH_27/PF13463_6/0_057HTH_27/PF13463_6/3e03HTH_27/PF13463_6/3_4e03HTH_45/PF14947_6/0_14HTH_45/PF14947_6/2_7e03MarR_2/PF12802_7/1MarR_2/PF12802_7/3e0
MTDKETQQLETLRTLDDLFNEGVTPNTLDLAQRLSVDHERMVGVIKSLEMMNKVTTVSKTQSVYKLTKEGEEAVALGSPEHRLVTYLRKAGPQTAEEIRTAPEETKRALGLNAAMKTKAVQIKDGLVHVAANAPEADAVQQVLIKVEKGEALNSAEENDVKNLTKRRLIVKASHTYFDVHKAEQFSTVIEKLCTDLTKDMLLSGSWKDMSKSWALFPTQAEV